VPFPDGPGEPKLIQTVRWLARPIALLESCRRRYGDVFSLNFLGFKTPMVIVSDPEHVRGLYSESTNGLPPGRSAALLPLLGARSVLLTEGAEHLSRRKLMLPPFHGERMRRYEELVREIAERVIADWRPGRTFALHPHMQAITLDVILRAVFGIADGARADALRRELPLLLDGTSSAALQFRVLASRQTGRGDPMAALRAASESIDDVLLAEIADRRAAPPGDDILSGLIAARFEDGEAMSDRELRDQLMTLLLAGHETTATGLAWTVDLLLRHPETLARLRDEVARGEDAYLRAVVQEGLRLRPVVPIAGRRLTRELRAGDHLLAPGTDVTPAIWLTHTRPDLYPEPYAFRPERFLDQPPTTYGWIPFGGGVRRCLGAAFAEMEMRVVLAEIVRSVRLEAAAPRAERVTRRNITFSPRHGTRVRIASG